MSSGVDGSPSRRCQKNVDYTCAFCVSRPRLIAWSMVLGLASPLITILGRPSDCALQRGHLCWQILHVKVVVTTRDVHGLGNDVDLALHGLLKDVHLIADAGYRPMPGS